MGGETFFVGLGVVLLMAIVGGTLVFCATIVRGSFHAGPRHGVKILLAICSWGLIGAGCAVVAISILFAVAKGAFDAEVVFALIATLLVVGLVALSGVMLLATISQLPTGRTPESQSLGRHILILYFLGISFLLLPMLMLGPMPLFVLVAVFLAIAQFRRAGQGRLLWTLAVATEKGLPIEEELDAHAETLSGESRMHTRSLASSMRRGRSLPDALERIPHLVPRSAILAAHLGENSGELGRVLREEANRQTNQSWPARSKLSLTWFAIYCVSLIVIVEAIIGFLMYYIVPKFKKIFQDFDVELPELTEQLIIASDIAVNYFWLIPPLFPLTVAGIVLVGLGFYHGWGNLQAPILTRWFPRADTPNLLRRLAEGILANRPLGEVLRLISEHHHRLHIRSRVGRAELAVDAGLDPWQALEREGLLRHNERAVLDSATRVGNLPWALNVLADNLERRREYRLLCWFEFLRPFLVLAVGLLVGFICVAFFLPLVELIWRMA